MTRSQTTRFELAKSRLVRLPGTARDIHCESGTLWITQDGDPRDIVLEAGQQFRRDGNAGIIVYALAPAQLTVHHGFEGRSEGESRSAHPIASVACRSHAVPARSLALE